MQKISFILLAFNLVLSACSIAPTSTPVPMITVFQPTQVGVTPSAPTATNAVTVLPTPDQPEQATQIQPSPSETLTSSSSPVIYKIIPGESQLTYEVGEVFIDQNNRFNVAVGVSPQITGEITIDLNAPQNSRLGVITADISQFKSDNSRRDNAIRNRFLESARYPTVTFVATQIEGLPQTYQEGQEIQLKIRGDLTVRDVTRSVTFEATVRLQGDTLSGQASTAILMSDFGFGPINLIGILKTEDQVKVTLQFVARP